MSLAERAVVETAPCEALLNWCRDCYLRLPTTFDAERVIAQRLGAQIKDGCAFFGFWTPELLDHRVPEGDVFLEVLSPLEAIDLTRSHQDLTFERVLLPVSRFEAHTFAVVSGLRAGSRHEIGDFYALVWRDADGNWQRILDPLASSVPFGAFAPAELYDLETMQAARLDKAYYADRASAKQFKFGPPTNILQIHVPTATAGGTIASLARQFARLGERLCNNLPAEDGDAVYLGYDAVQLLPIEPTTVYETGPDFWRENTLEGGELSVTLSRPDTTNWGYDVVIAGMAAVNPVLLESGRPDELIDLAAVLHNFPKKPKMLILDVVFGHSDNQGLNALNPHYFAGPNMYGQNLAYRNPAVRAILLEMQRRKVNFGADGVRVDGAQDFKWWDASVQTQRHDDEYLQLMADVEQCVAGLRYRPWFIFEDGRPWPAEDWELSSSYRAVIDLQRDDDVFQWGPLTFAHNTPFLYSFWLSKYWRVKEILSSGERWISGTANHDTLRRGTQVNPKLNVNTRLGGTRMEILDKAYDNPAVGMLTYAVLPGVPMDFLNASARASWGFVRNQDDQYGVKVVSEEAISLKWQVDDYAYSIPANFRRLKDLGYATREDLKRFFEFLPALVEVTDYNLDEISSLLNGVEPALAGPESYSPATLKIVARAWMDDMHEYCNVVHSLSKLDFGQAEFMFSLRRFRRANPWLRHNLTQADYFDYVQPIDGRALFTAIRTAPDGRQFYAITHMEGVETAPFDPLSLPIPQLQGGDWSLLMQTPSIGSNYTGGELVLHDSMGLLFERQL